MKENERSGSRAQEKERIRQRYRGVDSSQLDVIPALPAASLDGGEQMQRVAVYARVSTDDPRQTSSYELQKNHYEDIVRQHPNWILIDIYADEGISGTSLRHRDSFVRMIRDCEAGKIDLILTKSVSRFARNILDCIGYARQLSAMRPPIGIYFETERIYTLNSNSEMSLSFIATLAQEESHTKSEIMNASIEMRFRRGIFLTPPLLGYDNDEDGNLVINESEALTVRLVFFMYLYGYSSQTIADTLTQLKRETKKGNTKWSSGSVLQILQNERHCGDVLARKTWTPNYLDHKSKKNKQERNQYRQKNHHEAIVSRDDFIAVQRMISNAKYGNKGFLPQLKVIDTGILKGFVSINPRWGAFQPDDYINASESVIEYSADAAEELKEPKPGELDLRKYEIARGQFFDMMDRISISITKEQIKFSTEAVRRFDSQYVELLIHPSLKLLAIRPVSKDNRNAMQWSKRYQGKIIPRQLSGTAYLPSLYKICNWDPVCKYRILGLYRNQEEEAILLFNLSDTEIFIPSESIPETEEDLELETTGASKSVLAYPASWADNFGSNYYEHSQKEQLSAVADDQQWAVHAEGTSYATEDSLNVTSSSEISENIQSLISTMKEGLQP